MCACGRAGRGDRPPACAVVEEDLGLNRRPASRVPDPPADNACNAWFGHRAPSSNGVDFARPNTPYRWQAMRRVGQERSCDAAHRVLVPLLGQIVDR